MGAIRHRGSDTPGGKGGTGGKPVKKQPVKKRKSDDDDFSGGRASDSGVTPTKEWVGGSRG